MQHTHGIISVLNFKNSISPQNIQQKFIFSTYSNRDQSFSQGKPFKRKQDPVSPRKRNGRLFAGQSGVVAGACSLKIILFCQTVQSVLNFYEA